MIREFRILLLSSAIILVPGTTVLAQGDSDTIVLGAAVSRRTISSRSSSVNIGDLAGLVVTPITSRSTRCAARRMMSI